MEFAYRDAPLPSDVENVAAMVQNTGFFRRDEVDVAVELIEEYLAKGEDSGYYFWFADRTSYSNQPAGYVCYGPTPCTIGSFDLYWIVVDKDCQGHGLGRILAGMAEKSAAKMNGKRMYVETSGKELYAPTQAFYRSIGYEEAARLKDFYDVGDDKIIYQKNI